MPKRLVAVSRPLSGFVRSSISDSMALSRIFGDHRRFGTCSCRLSASWPRTPWADGLTHRRQVVLVRGLGVIICDWIARVTHGPITVHWPLGAAPNEVTLSEFGIVTPHYQVAWSGAAGALDASMESTTRAPGYARDVDAALLRLGYHGPLPVSVVTCFTNPATASFVICTTATRCVSSYRTALPDRVESSRSVPGPRRPANRWTHRRLPSQ